MTTTATATPTIKDLEAQKAALEQELVQWNLGSPRRQAAMVQGVDVMADVRRLRLAIAQVDHAIVAGKLEDAARLAERTARELAEAQQVRDDAQARLAMHEYTRLVDEAQAAAGAAHVAQASHRDAAGRLRQLEKERARVEAAIAHAERALREA